MAEAEAEAETETAPKVKTCFVISPIGTDGSDSRRMADAVLWGAIVPALARTDSNPDGYTVIRADMISEAGIITNDIIRHLIEDDLVVAVLTSRNANVFYELGIRHAAKMPCIHLIAHGEEIPFDIKVSRTIMYDPADWQSNLACQKKLADYAIAFERAPETAISNPVYQALSMIDLLKSNDPTVRQLAEVLELVYELKGSMKAELAQMHSELSRIRNPSPFEGRGSVGGITLATTGQTLPIPEGYGLSAKGLFPLPNSGITLSNPFEAQSIAVGALTDVQGKVRMAGQPPLKEPKKGDAS